MKTKKHSKELKARVVLELLKQDQTVAQICSKYKVSPYCVKDWKKKVVSQLPQLFEVKRSQGDSESEALVRDLYEQIGRLKVENDFYKKKLPF